MDLQLRNKVALVTAASRGLGFACARKLAIEGARVAICSRNQENLERAAHSISTETGREIFSISSDLTIPSDVENIVRKIETSLGDIEILVMSTPHPPTKPFSQASQEDFDDGYTILLKPAIQLTNLLIPAMKMRQSGRLIYIGSIFGLEPETLSAIQSAFRTALNALVKCISNEVAPFGICANVICPGYFDTPLVRELAKSITNTPGLSQDPITDWKNASPSKTLGDPDDLGALAAFLASPYAKFINGTTITIDGGLLRHY